MKPGDKLRNGATVIALSSCNADEWVILALYPGYEPYVTWRCVRPGNGDDTYAGHYFQNINKAVADYMER